MQQATCSVVTDALSASSSCPVCSLLCSLVFRFNLKNSRRLWRSQKREFQERSRRRGRFSSSNFPSLPENAQTLAVIAFRDAGKWCEEFPAASKFAGKLFQQGISDSHSLLEVSRFKPFLLCSLSLFLSSSVANRRSSLATTGSTNTQANAQPMEDQFPPGKPQTGNYIFVNALPLLKGPESPGIKSHSKETPKEVFGGLRESSSKVAPNPRELNLIRKKPRKKVFGDSGKVAQK